MSIPEFDPKDYRVLIVDDEPDVRLLLTREIGDHGYMVDSAGDVTWALEELQKKHFDIVFSDVRLPDRDGLELLSQIKERYPETEVVMMSGYSSMEAVGKALRLGAFDYLSKPLGDINIVTACIKRAIDKVRLQRSVSEHIQKLEEKTTQLESEINERKRVEQDLIDARANAEQLAEAKSQFLANMSHEIRTPMNGVIGMTALLLRTELSERQLRYVETIRRSGDGLLTIIDDILDFSKVEAGKIELQNINFNLSRTIEDVAELLAPEAHRKQLQLMSHIHSNVPRWVKGDPGRLRQILTNLAGNALKFTDKGEVVLECEVVEEASTFTSIKLSIRDTGIGIAAEHQKDLFNSFTQVDETNTRKYGGTGLGLAISKQLVELLGGEIGVKSGRGEGSTFWFTMPFRKATQEVISPPQIDSTKLQGQGILFVDDNPTMLQILTEHAESWGMKAYIAHSGVEALKHLEEESSEQPKIQVALIDVFIPGMDGLELTKRIREIPQHTYTPIVMATAFPKRGDAERALKAGISAYLPKPLRENELRECLLEVLTENRVRDLPDNLVTRHSMADQATVQTGQPRVLVAEDNIVNQEVTREMLVELGYDVTVAENGQEAVEAFKEGGFSAILMDCQMPIMTGQEATMAIRELEHDGNLRPVPILALTANVMAEDKRNALESGMDDFLIKPINPNDLEAALKKWLEKTDTIIGGDIEATTTEVLTSDVRRSKRVIELFLKDLNDRIPAIDSAISSGNANELLQLAHGLKGSSLQIGAPGLASLARDLESVGSLTRLENAREVLNQLNSEVERVRTALQDTVQT